tara:strand:+ start:295 stop:831 length:537 start_codon:yes stop_codon:yes gene_type:complete
MKLINHEKSKKNINILYINNYYALNTDDDFSILINELRKFDDYSINYFVKLLSKIKINSNYLICVVPSKKIKGRKSGIREMCIRLLKKLPIENGLHLLHRVSDITPDSIRYGRPSVDEQFHSLELIDKQKIINKTIILFDDYIDSGNTIIAAGTLFIEAGAQKVISITLGSKIDLMNF